MTFAGSPAFPDDDGRRSPYARDLDGARLSVLSTSSGDPVAYEVPEALAAEKAGVSWSVTPSRRGSGPDGACPLEAVAFSPRL